MNLDNLKTAFAKERHAEFMIASGGAILIAVMVSLLDPETLKLLDLSGPIPGALARVIFWGVSILSGTYLIYKGLNRIDRERSASYPPHAAPTIFPDATNPLSIQITHGNTQISIHIQPDKNSP